MDLRMYILWLLSPFLVVSCTKDAKPSTSPCLFDFPHTLTLNVKENSTITIPFSLNNNNNNNNNNSECNFAGNFEITVSKSGDGKTLDSVYCNLHQENGTCVEPVTEDICKCMPEQGQYQFQKTFTRNDTTTWTWRTDPKIADDKQLFVNVTCDEDFSELTTTGTNGGRNAHSYRGTEPSIITYVAAGGAALAVLASVSVTVFVITRMWNRRNDLQVRFYDDIPDGGANEQDEQAGVLVNLGLDGHDDGDVIMQNGEAGNAGRIPRGAAAPNAHDEIPARDHRAGPGRCSAPQGAAAAQPEAVAEGDVYVAVSDILARKKQAQK